MRQQQLRIKIRVGTRDLEPQQRDVRRYVKLAYFAMAACGLAAFAYLGGESDAHLASEGAPPCEFCLWACRPNPAKKDAHDVAYHIVDTQCLVEDDRV